MSSKAFPKHAVASRQVATTTFSTHEIKCQTLVPTGSVKAENRSRSIGVGYDEIVKYAARERYGSIG